MFQAGSNRIRSAMMPSPEANNFIQRKDSVDEDDDQASVIAGALKNKASSELTSTRKTTVASRTYYSTNAAGTGSSDLGQLIVINHLKSKAESLAFSVHGESHMGDAKTPEKTFSSVTSARANGANSTSSSVAKKSESTNSYCVTSHRGAGNKMSSAGSRSAPSRFLDKLVGKIGSPSVSSARNGLPPMTARQIEESRNPSNKHLSKTDKNARSLAEEAEQDRLKASALSDADRDKLAKLPRVHASKPGSAASSANSQLMNPESGYDARRMKRLAESAKQPPPSGSLNGKLKDNRP